MPADPPTGPESLRTDTPVTHLAMWSGPRNLSTAMMRSFGNRPRTIVADEPFYAHYLRQNPGLDHPGRDEVITQHETDPAKVAESLTAPLPPDIDLHYQKHMCHHMIAGVPTAWMDRVRHVFLIRDPRDVVRSFAKVMPEVTLDEIGLPRQRELFREAADRTGTTPAVIDSDDVLADPRGVLTKLCEHVGLPFDEGMLNWPPGPRDSDGVWAKHWYAGVHQSTGFARRTEKTDTVPTRYEPLIESAQPLYQELAQHRIR